jgi:hypothetical protein
MPDVPGRLAEIISAGPAIITHAAGVEWFGEDSFAKQIGQSFMTYRGYGSGELVAEHHVGRIVDMMAQCMQCPGIFTFVVFKVAAADAAGADFDQHLIYSAGAHGDIFDNDFAWSFKYCSFHDDTSIALAHQYALRRPD